MLKVTLDLSCNVCGSDQFMLPTLADDVQDVRCADCAAFKCKSDDLERAMSAVHQKVPARPGL
ncbi:hypothetical protein [Salinicola rhizosphaerae]|uniref:Uncharacterized protein n=1 Tax=Salinicola rhizosphaerae TaxID=1443141 RepID=A0ABQ3DRV5_9GAMM|nr:hypothetical protein [Salinicola rhizosphaerae]GHB12257.1 hypothetical protein GCM10009038_07490 [Salinicola rhizosphaerae]